MSLLDAGEVRALLQRLQWVLDEGVFPAYPACAAAVAAGANRPRPAAR